MEKKKDGVNHDIVVRRTSTARYVTQYLDGPDDTFPSMDELEAGHFLAPVLGDPLVIVNHPMMISNIAEAHPDNSPPIASFKIHHIRGGLIVTFISHHYWNSLSGMNAWFKLLSANCRHEASPSDNPLPSFDPGCLDRTLVEQYARKQLPAANKTKRATAPPRNTGRNQTFHPSCSALFHLPKSRAAELKLLASPPASEGGWISTFDAACGLLWRVLSRLREPVYTPGWDSRPIWAQGVSFARIFTDPPLPIQLQGNLHLDVNSLMSETPSPTLREVAHTAPLSTLAAYPRRMTDGVTVEMLADELRRHQGVVNKADLSINVDMLPPMSNLVSDWRGVDVCSMEYGFGKPIAWRLLMGKVALSQICVYAARHGPSGEDEGMEVLLTVENELLGKLIGDEDWVKFFEYRGLDAWDGDEKPSEVPVKGDGAVKSRL